MFSFFDSRLNIFESKVSNFTSINFIYYNFEVEICQRNKETLQTGKERPENPVQKVSY